MSIAPLDATGSVATAYNEWPQERFYGAQSPLTIRPLNVLNMKIQTRHFDQTHVLFDEDLVPEFEPALFDPQSFLADSDINRLGRGAAYLFQFHGVDMVLRHYQRGGLVRFVNRDSYLYRGLQNTRMWCEFNLLEQLFSADLPVPRPIAIRCVRHNRFCYRGDLITQTIPNSETLAERLNRIELPNALWEQLGATIARFHQAGAYHADLNANNIMIDQHQQFYLIDFDKGELRSPSDQPWQQQNLKRLLRSFAKLKHRSPHMHFHERHWQLLLSGYRAYTTA